MQSSRSALVLDPHHCPPRRLTLQKMPFRLCLLATLFACVALTQEAQAPTDVRATPRGALQGFLEACREREYRRAASFLDVGSAHAPEELALQLKQVLDQRLDRDPALLSNSPEGDLTDGLDPKYELLLTTLLNGRSVDLLLERVNNNGTHIWLVSRQTVQLIPALHRNLEASTLERYVPASLRVAGPLDTPLWVWFALLLLVAISLALARLLSRLVVKAAGAVAKRTPSDLDDRLTGSVVNPMRVLLTVALFRAGLFALPASIILRTAVGRLLVALTFLALAWLAMRVIDVIAAKALSTLSGRHLASASSVMPLARRTAKAGAMITAVIASLNSWGYNTTALLAGLGVGGIAVALAAQKTIENLFGGVAVTTDKPVLVGDFCRYGTRMGTVEDIGLRSTRVRTLDRTLVSIPNGQFSSFEIENFARRDKIFFNPTLQLRRDTTPAQLRMLTSSLKELLLDQELVEKDTARVRFVRIAPYSLDVEVFSYLLTTDYNDFLAQQEALLLSILDRVAAAGTALAVPSQMNFLARDPHSRHQSIESRA